MNRIVSHLVALLLSMHMLLGCCWHHAHACSPACGAAATAACTHAHGDDDGDDHCQQGSGGQPSHHPTDACSGERCSFVAPPRTTAVGPLLDAPWLGPWLLVSLELPPDAGAPGWQRACVAPLPAHRLHLVYRVLRI